MLIERRINWNLIVYLDAMVNQAEYPNAKFEKSKKQKRKG